MKSQDRQVGKGHFNRKSQRDVSEVDFVFLRSDITEVEWTDFTFVWIGSDNLSLAKNEWLADILQYPVNL